ncbi:hypothetical protein AGOR_G00210310 [Albula goreensis]|uniref:Ig-like domain-containing protein n=1 Tax=Albula goreensis TaxID=1534307 RepID=A0A8T3CQL0_9TELE|nr:hypothetical protein AGOR_G00210310 [Albula goreensis]
MRQAIVLSHRYANVCAEKLPRILKKTRDRSSVNLTCPTLRMKYSVFTAVLVAIVYITAKAEAHIDIKVIACQTGDISPEFEQQIDGNEIFYVDMETKETIITVPEFAGKWTASGAAQEAQANYPICVNNLNVAVQAEKNPPEEIDPPQSTIFPRNKVVLGKRNTLICLANNFYPAPVKVKWTKNNVVVNDEVTLSRYYPNYDFTFHQMSTLSIIPEEGDIYSCTVEHKGLPKPLTRIWEPEVHMESDTAETAFCGIGLTLGLLGVGVGTFFLIKGNNCN